MSSWVQATLAIGTMAGLYSAIFVSFMIGDMRDMRRRLAAVESKVGSEVRWPKPILGATPDDSADFAAAWAACAAIGRPKLERGYSLRSDPNERYEASIYLNSPEGTTTNVSGRGRLQPRHSCRPWRRASRWPCSG